MSRLQDRVALVTGAGSGQGRAIALLFAREGARVAVSDVQFAGVKETVGLAQDRGWNAMHPIQADVSDEDSVRSMVQETAGRYGGLHILVNCAGRVGPGDKPTCDLLTREEWDAVLGVNLTGAWLGTKYAAPVIRDSGGGSIINIASTAGLRPFAGAAPYCVSKAGMLMLTKTTALEYVSWGIRVTAICPGHIDTPMMEHVIRDMVSSGDLNARQRVHMSSNPMGRLGTADEVGLTALFLASDDASFVTGSYIFVDGGYMAG